MSYPDRHVSLWFIHTLIGYVTVYRDPPYKDDQDGRGEWSWKGQIHDFSLHDVESNWLQFTPYLVRNEPREMRLTTATAGERARWEFTRNPEDHRIWLSQDGYLMQPFCEQFLRRSRLMTLDLHEVVSCRFL